MYLSNIPILVLSATIPAVLADGGYLGSCSSNYAAYINGAARGLTADCKKADGSTVRSSLDVTDCYRNANGVIGCSGPG